MSAIDDLDLPHSVVTRVIKEALGENGTLSKDAKLAFVRSTTVFISYLTWTANDVAKERLHKTVSADDVMRALELCEFGEFVDVLKEELNVFKADKQAKRLAKKAEKEMAQGPPSDAQLASPPINNEVVVEILPEISQERRASYTPSKTASGSKTVSASTSTVPSPKARRISGASVSSFVGEMQDMDIDVLPPVVTIDSNDETEDDLYVAEVQTKKSSESDSDVIVLV